MTVSIKTKIQALSRFNETVDLLARSALAKLMASPHYTLDYQKMMRREWISADGLTEDAVHAFVLKVRLLVQDHDGFSIRRLAEDIYAHESVPTALRSRFAEQRQKWREHMDMPSVIKHLGEDRNFTHGELFDALMYGGLVHVNSDKVGLFDRLTKQGVFSSVVCVSFLVSLRMFLDVVCAIRDIDAELLSHWEC